MKIIIIVSLIVIALVFLLNAASFDGRGDKDSVIHHKKDKND